MYFPHELTALSSPDHLELDLQTVDLGPVTIGRLNWGTEVSIACDYPDAYEINIPVSGVLESRAGSVRTTSEAGQATVFAADRPSLITRWSADCQVVGVKFDAEYLEREADRVRAAPLRSRLLLPDQIDLSGPDEKSWFALVRALTAQLREPADLLANPLLANPPRRSATRQCGQQRVYPGGLTGGGRYRPATADGEAGPRRVARRSGSRLAAGRHGRGRRIEPAATAGGFRRACRRHPHGDAARHSSESGTRRPDVVG
ncbi:hypothetical protein GOAMI_32_00490 [Gordonia amicalis NBRC 100051 = JCM 11271]|nr:hypothetical protein GOAMI_32_00490 [Gordonia amicalis NBRC 100051 = JCM 11271]